MAVFGEAQVRVSEEDGSSVVFSSSVLEDGRTEVTSSDGRDFRARLGVDGELVASTHGVVVLG